VSPSIPAPPIGRRVASSTEASIDGFGATPGAVPRRRRTRRHVRSLNSRLVVTVCHNKGSCGAGRGGIRHDQRNHQALAGIGEDGLQKPLTSGPPPPAGVKPCADWSSGRRRQGAGIRGNRDEHLERRPHLSEGRHARRGAIRTPTGIRQPMIKGRREEWPGGQPGTRHQAVHGTGWPR